MGWLEGSSQVLEITSITIVVGVLMIVVGRV